MAYLVFDVALPLENEKRSLRSRRWLVRWLQPHIGTARASL